MTILFPLDFARMQIYFDCNSTTPVDPRVLDAMLPYLRENFGNPGSAHVYGAQAATAVEASREQVARLVGGDPAQVVFCSSATEAINTVIASVPTGVIIRSAVEHAATLESTDRASADGATLVTLGVDRDGGLDLAALRETLNHGPALVTLLWANNETGVIFPVAEIAEICASRGALLHVDAVQAAGRLDIDLTSTSIDLLSISSHKLFGPKGVGALLVRNPATIRPLLRGGGQEHGLRAGTENVPGIVGFGEAARLAHHERSARVEAVRALRNRLEESVLARVPRSWINGRKSPRIANTANIGFDSIDGDAMVGVLDAAGIAVSTGSACHSRSTEPSHVIRAMTGSHRKAQESVRFSLSHLNTNEEVDYVIDAICEAVAKLS